MRFFLFFFPLLLLIHCYKKQDHQVTAPVWPNYTISGVIVDADDSTPVSGIQLTFQAEQQLYACETKTYIISSDENGQFEQAAVCPGLYTLSLFSNDLTLQQQRFSLQHQDTTLLIKLPKILAGELIFSKSQINGIAWPNADSLAFLSLWESTTQNNALFNRIFEGTLNSVFRTAIPFPLTNEYPDLNGLAFSDSFYYSFGGGFSDPTIFQIDQKSQKIKNRFSAPHRLSDLTIDGGTFWATTTRQSLINWQLQTPESIQEFKAPGNHPRGIAWDGNSMWSSDQGQFNFPRLYKHTSDMSVESTFIPVGLINNQKALILPEFLAYSSNGFLWCISPLSNGDKGIFKFHPTSL